MGATIIPTLRYRDAARMIDWLGEAFGFTEHMVVKGDDGGIVHAQLVRGDAMIMLSSARDDDFDRLQSTPEKLGGTTQSPYIIAPDTDAVHATAKAAGAEMAIDIHAPAYGGRAFSCRDPEGHLWNFGSYDPWAK